MSGKLTITSPSGLAIQDLGSTSGTAPSSNRYFGITYLDSNGTTYGNVRTIYGTDKSISIQLIALSGSNSSAVRTVLTSAGKALAYAPAPESQNNADNIATTSWVRSKISAATGKAVTAFSFLNEENNIETDYLIDVLASINDFSSNMIFLWIWIWN